VKSLFQHAKSRYRFHASWLVVLFGPLLLTGCAVGPKYQRPAMAEVPSQYLESGNLKVAQPSDQMIRGKWWEVFQDSQLNALEGQIEVNNQTLKQAQAQFAQARAIVRYNRADFYPTVTGGFTPTRNRISANRAVKTLSGQTYNDVLLGLDVSYEPDVWGRVRRTVEASRENAQASAADLETVRLSLQAELAMDYFQMRSLDGEEQLLQSTVQTYQEALQLTLNRFHGGVASEVDVDQAQTQLETTRAQAIDVQVQRAQFQHAIAVLAGKPASSFQLAFSPLQAPPPVIPPGLPSLLLERRPDVAGAERRAAAANANIGIARAAYFPLISLSASGGVESAAMSTLFNGPSGFWNIGASVVQTVFDAGRRRAASDQAYAAYDQSAAAYRQTVLTAFQEVEDNLAAQRILEDEGKTQEGAVAAAQKLLNQSMTRYTGGVTTYLEVLTSQSTALSDERVAVQILGRRMTAAVLLIKALGGGWDASQLPTFTEVSRRQAPGRTSTQSAAK